MGAFWHEYFGIDRPFGLYWRMIEIWTEQDGPDAYLSRAAAAADGMTIIQQPAQEAIFSYIISQNNNIPRIKSCIAALCRRFGKPGVTPDGHEYYTFPSYFNLVDADKLQGLGLGYRDKYIAGVAAALQSGALDIPAVREMQYEQAKAVLKTLPGIGEKVANCILLYGLGHLEAFPVDVWIKRVLDREFPGDTFPAVRYAAYGGLVQQIIFYYERMMQHDKRKSDADT